VVVICELKLQFNLELILQAVDRAAACDEVWLAAYMSARGKGREHDRRFRALCRRLGFGLLGVGKKGEVELLLSPAALPPRRDPRPDDLTGRFSAVDLVRVASAALGGQGGGGRPDMAQAGGPDASKANDAIAAVKAALEAA
ncbi:DHHA1 domain-containing protein, partial [Mesorhizobium sp. M1C.F.Ca.ET.212.01.1.1]|uniref:DHHA1 domain-containing protein n=1 Tax=Mesorhizobium sp. M1C.F.Ca.ET.212.01.1.1 TaxID=2500527 RepID=UPI001FE18A57